MALHSSVDFKHLPSFFDFSMPTFHSKVIYPFKIIKRKWPTTVKGFFELKCFMEWSASEVVEDAENRLEFKKILSYHENN